MSLSERNTADLVVLCITGIIGFVLISLTIAVIVIEILHPGTDTSAIVEAESEVLAVLVGALVGFISGRVHGRTETQSEP